MRAVLEEIEQNIACLIPDDGSKARYVSREDLPDEIQVGDILEIEFDEKGKLISAERLFNEKKRRLNRNENKRMKLLQRKKE